MDRTKTIIIAGILVSLITMALIVLITNLNQGNANVHLEEISTIISSHQDINGIVKGYNIEITAKFKNYGSSTSFQSRIQIQAQNIVGWNQQSGYWLNTTFAGQLHQDEEREFTLTINPFNVVAGTSATGDFGKRVAFNIDEYTITNHYTWWGSENNQFTTENITQGETQFTVISPADYTNGTAKYYMFAVVMYSYEWDTTPNHPAHNIIGPEAFAEPLKVGTALNDTNQETYNDGFNELLFKNFEWQWTYFAHNFSADVDDYLARLDELRQVPTELLGLESNAFENQWNQLKSGLTTNNGFDYLIGMDHRRWDHLCIDDCFAGYAPGKNMFILFNDRRFSILNENLSLNEEEWRGAFLHEFSHTIGMRHIDKFLYENQTEKIAIYYIENSFLLGGHINPTSGYRWLHPDTKQLMIGSDDPHSFSSRKYQFFR